MEKKNRGGKFRKGEKIYGLGFDNGCKKNIEMEKKKREGKFI